MEVNIIPGFIQGHCEPVHYDPESVSVKIQINKKNIHIQIICQKATITTQWTYRQLISQTANKMTKPW